MILYFIGYSYLLKFAYLLNINILIVQHIHLKLYTILNLQSSNISTCVFLLKFLLMCSYSFQPLSQDAECDNGEGHESDELEIIEFDRCNLTKR